MPRPKKIATAEPMPVVTEAERSAIEAVQASAAKQEPAMRKARESATTQPPPFGAGANYGKSYISFRIYHPDMGLVFNVSFSDTPLDEVSEVAALYIEQGYRPCTSPDAPVSRETPAASAPATDRYAPAYEHRAGSRPRATRDNALVLPFGKYKGQTLEYVERHDHDYVDWLADNANMSDIRKAAAKLRNQRDDDIPF